LVVQVDGKLMGPFGRSRLCRSLSPFNVLCHRFILLITLLPTQTNSSTTSGPIYPRFTNLARNTSRGDLGALATRLSLTTMNQELINQLSAREWMNFLTNVCPGAPIWLPVSSSALDF
jgi:hypothetical protein